MNISSPTSTSLQLSWSTINDLYWHGYKRGYCVRYLARGSSASNTQDVADFNVLETVINGLDHFTRYYVYVSGKTSPGCGADVRTSFVTLEHGMEN